MFVEKDWNGLTAGVWADYLHIRTVLPLVGCRNDSILH